MELKKPATLESSECPIINTFYSSWECRAAGVLSCHAPERHRLGKKEKNPVAADTLHLTWDITVKQQGWIPDTDPFGMANGFSVSFLGDDVFKGEVGRCPAKAAREVQLRAKAEGTKPHH